MDSNDDFLISLLNNQSHTVIYSLIKRSYEDLKDRINNYLYGNIIFYRSFEYLKNNYKKYNIKDSFLIRYTPFSLWYNFLYKEYTIDAINIQLRNEKIKRLYVK